MIESILLWVFALVSAPFFAGVIFKVKAFFGGRKGSPVLINYYTLIKLFKKGSVYSTSTTFVFRLGPVVNLGVAATVLLFLPIAGHRPVLSFDGDGIFVLYLLGLARFFIIAQNVMMRGFSKVPRPPGEGKACRQAGQGEGIRTLQRQQMLSFIQEFFLANWESSREVSAYFRD